MQHVYVASYAYRLPIVPDALSACQCHASDKLNWICPSFLREIQPNDFNLSLSLSLAHSLRGGPVVARVDVIAAARITFERGPSFASVGHKMEHKVTRHGGGRAVGYSNSSSVYIGSRI